MCYVLNVWCTVYNIYKTLNKIIPRSGMMVQDLVFNLIFITCCHVNRFQRLLQLLKKYSHSLSIKRWLNTVRGIKPKRLFHRFDNARLYLITLHYAKKDSLLVIYDFQPLYDEILKKSLMKCTGLCITKSIRSVITKTLEM